MEIRQTFLDYFSNLEHTFIPSSNVMSDDSSLFFTNAGMNQFRQIFLGNKEIEVKSAYNSQKCIRAGGKHNDLDDVGLDTYHHTFFEMLGSWSFNHYWKEEAIKYAWNLLTNEYKLNPDQIYITYFEGNDKIPCDYETKEIWTKYLPSSRILPFGSKDNFWEMGSTGPCGVCTEIHYDRKNLQKPELVNADSPDVIEIWNVVFTEYYRDENGEITKLSNRFVDTGMGLERLVSILENTTDNYQTSLFQPIIQYITELSIMEVPEYGESEEIDISYRIISDHVRTLAIALTDGGQIKTHSGSDQVLKRIFRRCLLCCQKLNLPKHSISKLVRKAGQTLDFFQLNNLDNICDVLDKEELQFTKILRAGRKKLLKIENPNERDLVTLYHTYGYPIELSLMEDQSKKYDQDVINQYLEEHKSKS